MLNVRSKVMRETFKRRSRTSRRPPLAYSNHRKKQRNSHYNMPVGDKITFKKSVRPNDNFTTLNTRQDKIWSGVLHTLDILPPQPLFQFKRGIKKIIQDIYLKKYLKGGSK